MKSTISKNTILNLVGQGIPMIVALFAIPVAIHYLGEERFGILTIAWLIIGNSVIFDMGMGRAAIKFAAEALGNEEEQRIPVILGSAVRVQLLLGSVAGIAIFAAVPFLVNNFFTIPEAYLVESRKAFLFASIAIPIVLSTGSYRGIIEARQRFDVVNYYKIIFSSLTYLSPFIGMLFGWGLGEITALLICFRTIQLVIFHVTCVFLFPNVNWKDALLFDPHLLRKMFKFGGWVAISNVISVGQENAERLLLGGLLPIAFVTYFSVPKDILDRIYILPGSLSTALFPVITVMAVAKKNIIGLFIRSFKAVGMVVGLVLFFLITLADPLLTIWISEKFAAASASVVRILAFGVLASSFNILAMTLFQGIGRPDITAKQQIMRFPIIMLVGWLLIAKLGLIGAAFSWSFGRILALGMNFWAMYRQLCWRIQDIFSIRNILSLLALPVTISIYYVFISFLNVDSDLALLLFSGAGAAFFILLFWLFVFSSEERVWLYRSILKFHFNK